MARQNRCHAIDVIGFSVMSNHFHTILACAIYVDLNPIRDMVTTTPEESQFTPAYQRIQARQKRAGKRGAIPPQLAPILERRQVSANCWVDGVTGFGRWFARGWAGRRAWRPSANGVAATGCKAFHTLDRRSPELAFTCSGPI